MSSLSGADGEDLLLDLERKKELALKGWRGSRKTRPLGCTYTPAVPPGCTYTPGAPTGCTYTPEQAAHAARESFSPLSFCFNPNPEFSKKDHEALLQQACSQLQQVLKNPSSCLALQFNLEAISKLLPFLNEHKNFQTLKSHQVCNRLLLSHLTAAVLHAVAEQKVPNPKR